MASEQGTPARAAPILAEFEANLKTVSGEGTTALFGPAFSMFRQSVRAYDAGSLELAAIGCRASVESSGYLLLTRNRDGTHGWRIQHPRDLAGSIRRVSLREIIDGLSAEGYLNGDLLSAAIRIQQHGIAVAHYVAVNDRKEDERIRRMLSGDHPGGSLVIEDVAPLPLEILQDLRSAAAILLHLVRTDLAAGIEAERSNRNERPM